VPGVTADPRILVPTAAVFERGGLTGVFVAKDGRAHLRWVAPGARDGETVEIRAGVEPGDRVVLVPEGLVDGSSVREVGGKSGAGTAPAETR
jgi:HlyD family secretion protein